MPDSTEETDVGHAGWISGCVLLSCFYLLPLLFLLQSRRDQKKNSAPASWWELEDSWQLSTFTFIGLMMPGRNHRLEEKSRNRPRNRDIVLQNFLGFSWFLLTVGSFFQFNLHVPATSLQKLIHRAQREECSCEGFWRSELGLGWTWSSLICYIFARDGDNFYLLAGTSSSISISNRNNKEEETLAKNLFPLKRTKEEIGPGLLFPYWNYFQ